MSQGCSLELITDVLFFCDMQIYWLMHKNVRFIQLFQSLRSPSYHSMIDRDNSFVFLVDLLCFKADLLLGRYKSFADIMLWFCKTTLSLDCKCLMKLPCKWGNWKKCTERRDFWGESYAEFWEMLSFSFCWQNMQRRLCIITARPVGAFHSLMLP